MKKLFWMLQAGCVFIATWCLSLVPAHRTEGVGKRLGRLFMSAAPGRFRVAVENIRLARPFFTSHAADGWAGHTPEYVAQGMFEHLGQSLVEISQMYHGRAGYLIDEVVLKGVEHYQQAKTGGKGIILLTGHCGNWEVVGIAYSLLFQEQLSVVARKQDNPYLNAFVEQVRRRYDNTVIYKQNAVRGIMSATRHGGVVALLVDQALSPSEGGVRVPFLGRPAWTSKTPVVLARKTGAAVVPAFSYRENGHHVIEFHPEIRFSSETDDTALLEDVARYTRTLEEYIMAHPTNWFWLHKRWKDYQ